jgi:hypothetical protein
MTYVLSVIGDVPIYSEAPLAINDVCAFSGKRRSRRQRGTSGEFVNLEDLPVRSSKMLLVGGFAYRYS